jgi:trans-aconitate 2-methyltransferase
VRTRWDPGQLRRFAVERERPFWDLLARVRAVDPSYVVDLGCGSGELTGALAGRWPRAEVTGVDSSPEMLAEAATRGTGRLGFVEADLREWRPDRPVDVLVSNATLQWVPGHLDLLPDLAGWLAPAGWLAVQVPDNFTEPSHRLLYELRSEPRWRERLGEGADRRAAVRPPQTYLERLAGLGMVADVWSTTYFHLLAGEDAVLEWTSGSALRPVLSVLDEAEAAEFRASYAERLRQAYPSAPYGTVFPFRRTFMVGQRP